MGDFDFEIFVNVKGKTYRMQVFRIYDGDSLERFNVVGGKRGIVLQSNRPQLLREKSKKAINWKLLEGDISESDDAQAAEALNKIIIEIEYKIKDQGTSTYQYIRGKE